ncbi:MAG: TolC family protein [Desulfovibrio sp.]|nr:TolC family protein [Desulfovibrio sp.]
MSLAAVIDMALERNEDIKESFRRISASEASVMAAKGAYDLNVFNTTRYGRFSSLSEGDYAVTDLSNATKSYFRSDSGLRQRVPTGGTLTAYYTGTNEQLLGVYGLRKQRDRNYVTLEFAQSLLKGIADKEVRGAIANALLAVSDSEEGRNLVISQVVLEVIRAYWTLEVSLNNLKIGQKVLGMAQEVQRREGVRFNQGISQGVDVDRANLAVKQREYAVLQYRRDVAVAQERLVLLINYPGYVKGTDILPSSPPNSTVAPLPDADKSFDVAINSRYELKQLAIMLQQLDIEYDVATNKLLPTLDVNAGLTTSNGNETLRSAENFKDTDDRGSWFVGLTFSYPLQNREARGTRERSRQLILIAKDRVSKTRRSVETEVKDALHNLVLAKQGIPVAKSAYQAAQQTVAGEVKRFEMGGVSNRDLLSSHDALGREEINYHTAIVNYNMALAEYQYACAGLLDRCGVVVGKESARLR